MLLCPTQPQWMVIETVVKNKHLLLSRVPAFHYLPTAVDKKKVYGEFYPHVFATPSGSTLIYTCLLSIPQLPTNRDVAVQPQDFTASLTR